MRERALVRLDGHLVLVGAGSEADEPAAAGPLGAAERELGSPAQARLVPHAALRRLDGERVAAAAAVALEADPTGQVLVQHRPGVLPPDPPEIEALGQAD